MKVALVVLTLLGTLALGSAIEYGYCKFVGTTAEPNINGWATFVPATATTVRMTIRLNGITTNANADHGVHIHQYGDISDLTAGQSVGSHYNPNNEPHGCPPGDRHVGDTGNWSVRNGAIDDFKDLDLLSLTGGQSIIGRAVVIHSDPDNCVNVSSSGSRLALCVIGIGNPSLYDPSETTNPAASGATDTQYAVCNLRPTAVSGNLAMGTVWFSQSPGQPTIVTAAITGITGEHGFHIHQYGDLSFVTNATSSGSHYDPLSTGHHSIPIPGVSNRHLGDMGNIFHYEGNTAYYRYSNNLISLTGVNNIIGRAVILHADRDNCSQPIGFSGARLAHCVIGITGSAPTALPNTVPSYQEWGFCPDRPSTTGVPEPTQDGEDSVASVMPVAVVALVAALAFLLM